MYDSDLVITTSPLTSSAPDIATYLLLTDFISSRHSNLSIAS
jgi:hypothetical protein